jgi:fibronectin-binding autotransporter adhesin
MLICIKSLKHRPTMKIQSFARVVAVLSFALVRLSVPAQVLSWDPDGATVGTSISGNWDNITTNWTATPDSGVNTVWVPGDEANFGIAADYTVTVTEPITVGNITVSGSAGILTIAGSSANSLTLASAATLATGGRNVALSAPINGSFGLTRSGGGTVTLSGASTYSGATTLTAGTLAVGVDSVSSGGVITSGPFGTGPVTFSTTASTMTTSAGARTVENPMTLSANLSIGGTAAMTFTNGVWTLVGGGRTLTVNNSADTTLASNLADDGTARTLTKAGTGRLIMKVGPGTSYLGGITASAGTLVAGNSTPFPTNNNNTITINGSTLDLNSFDVRLSRLAGNVSGSVLLGPNTLTAGCTVSSEFKGVISGTGGYVKVGGTSQVLSGTNTFTGGILITEGPVYFPTNGLGSPYSLGPGPNTITITNTGWWGANVVGTSIITNKVLLANVGPTAILDPAGGGTVIWEQAGQISGTGGLLRTGAKGSGVVILSGSNTFSGGVQMDGRGIVLGNKNALGTAPLTIGNPAFPPTNNTIYLATTLDLIGANAVTNSATVNQDFSFNGPVPGGLGLEMAGPVALSSGTKIISATGTGVALISGVISGSGGINKDGSSPLTLSANNGYTGSTIVSNGTLALTGSGSVGGSSDITVLSGGTLDASGRTDGTLTIGASQTLRGTGTIIGTVTVAGALAPGEPIGTLTVNGNLNLNNKALLEIDKSQFPANDSVIVNGTLNGGDTLTVTNAGAALLAAGDSFTLFNKAVSGFTTVNLPPGYSWDNQLATSGTITVLSTTFSTTPTNITSSVSGGNLTVSWPANYAGGWGLETSPDLVNWATVPDSRDVNSMSFPINPAGPPAFYRLRLLTQ